MRITTSTLIELFVGIVMLIATVIALRSLGKEKHSRWLTALATLPAFITLALFYSLAMHMHNALGGWPASIGERGFPASLVLHAHIAESCFYKLVLICFLVWPVAFLLCLFIPRWKRSLFYLGVYAFSCLLGLGLMLLAPSSFLDWWWD